MKRILCLLTVSILILTLCACGREPVLSPVYDGGIQATDGAMNYTARLVSDGETLNLSLASPDSVAGISFGFRDGELHTGLNGLDTVTSPDSLSSSSFPAIIYQTLVRTGEAQFQSTEDGIDTFTLLIGSDTATVTAKDGVIQSVVCGTAEILFK